MYQEEDYDDNDNDDRMNHNHVLRLLGWKQLQIGVLKLPEFNNQHLDFTTIIINLCVAFI